MKRALIAATVLVVGAAVVLIVLMNTVWLGSSGPETGTETKWVRVDPWSDPAIAQQPVTQTFIGACNIDPARADRANCEGGQECYLNADSTKAACGDPLSASWTIWGITLPPTPPYESTTTPTLYPVALRLINGAGCELEWRRADDTTDGWIGSAGYCTEADGDSYPFWARDVAGPLGVGYLYDAGASGYLRVAVRDGSPANPEYEDVNELLY